MEKVRVLSLFLSLSLSLSLCPASIQPWTYPFAFFSRRVKSPNPNGSMTLRHECTIELATKVTDTVEKLRNTLAHELCHIAAWVLSGEIKPPHGNAFKLWSVFLSLLSISLPLSLFSSP